MAIAVGAAPVLSRCGIPKRLRADAVPASGSATGCARDSGRGPSHVHVQYAATTAASASAARVASDTTAVSATFARSGERACIVVPARAGKLQATRATAVGNLWWNPYNTLVPQRGGPPETTTGGGSSPRCARLPQF